MADVMVIATAKAKPGMEEALERALCEVAQPTRAQPGCVRFSLYRAEDDPGVIVGVEQWASKQDHERHLQGTHFHKLDAAMSGLLAGPPEIRWHGVVDDIVSSEALQIVRYYFELWSQKN